MAEDRLAELRQAREAGDADAAILITRSAFVRAGREDDLRSMLVFAAELEELTAEVLALGERLSPWEDLRLAARRLGAPAVELTASLQLALLHLGAGNADLAARHVEALLDLLPDLEADPLHDMLDGQGADQAIVHVLDTLYYRHEDYEATARIAGKITARAPDLDIAWYFFAHSLNRLNRFEEAVVALGRLVELTPGQPGPLIASSRALAALGRTDDAIAAATEAMRLKPEDNQYRYIRAQIQHAAGDLDAALADYARVVEVAEAQARTEPPVAPARTQVQYTRDMPARDLADFARIARVHLLRQSARWAEAEEEARHLADHGDLPTSGAGRLFLGEIAQETGRHEDAVAHFGGYLALGALTPVPALLGRAVSLEALGRLDEAVADLDALCGQGEDRDAAAAVTALTALCERHPAHTGARKALGHALLENFAPARAVEVLADLHRPHPDDWQVLAWLGMAMVTTSDTEKDWNESADYARILTAVDHLVAAVRLAPDEHYPRSRLRWLVERACVLGPVVNRIAAGPEDGGFGVADALPELAAPFRSWCAAMALERERRWADSVAELTSARAAVERAGLPVLVGMIDIRLADNQIRLHDVQRALEHLAAAENATAELGMLPDMIREGVDGMSNRIHGAGGRMVLEDIDHRELSRAVRGTFFGMLDLLHAQAAHRIGDVETALRRWPDFPVGDVFENLHFRMMVLRDADRVDEAMELLPELAELATGEAEQVKVANITASLRLARGEFSAAAEVLEAALASGEHHSYVTDGLVSNLLVAYAGLGRARDVIELAGAHPLPENVPPRFAYGRMVTVARAFGLLGEHEEALRTFLDALALIDRVRGTLHDEQVRMTWQEMHVHVYEEAVLVALVADRPSVALDLVERAKSRAFVDQLGLGRVEPTERIQTMREALDDARQRLALLNELAASADPAAEWGLVHRVNELRPVGGVRLDDLAAELAAEREAVDRLAGALALEPLKGKSSVAAATLSTVEIHALLGERCVLAEYFVLDDDQTALFVMTPDDPVPVVHHIPLGAQRIAEDVDRHLGAARTLDVAAFAADFGPFVAPIAQHCAPGDVVVLVPHGQLHHVPLHALLLDRNPVCHLPSASLLRYRRRSSGDRGRRTALVLGDSRSDLVHARREAVAIAEVFGGAAVVGDDASRKRLVAGLADRPDVVHVACHGRFDGEHAAESALLLAPADTRIDAELSAADVFGLALGSNLVTLSACESGVSANRPGDELIGLSRAALHAGASSLVVSLWAVDDLSTELLMTAFYREVLAGVALAEALRRAQLALAATTARDVVAHCDAALAESDDPVAVAALLLARAGAEAVAGDVVAAISSCRRISLDGARGAVATRLRAHATRRLNLLSLKAEVDNAVDYTARPFAHPYHWAAFVLVGDWR